MHSWYGVEWWKHNVVPQVVKLERLNPTALLAIQTGCC